MMKFFQLICFCFGFSYSMDSIAMTTVSGQLSFPGGSSATSQTQNILVIAENPQNIAQNQILVVQFNQGQTVKNYSIILPSNDHNWRIKYQCTLCNAQGILTTGYYSSSGTSQNSSQATVLSGNQNHSGINLQMVRGFNINGMLSFPSGLSATNSTATVLVIAENPNNISENQILAVPFNIGQSQTAFTITLPDNGGNWRIKYQCTLCNAQGIITSAFYSNSGTTAQSSQATLLDSGQNHGNINIQMLRGVTVNGRLNFPDGLVATNHTTSILLVAEDPANVSENQILAVQFNVGESQKSYSLTLPDTGHDWRIKYQCTLCNGIGILTSAYYSTNGTVSDPSQATILSTGQNHAGVNLQLLRGIKVTGQISFPGNVFANSRTRNVLVIAENPQNPSQNQILSVPFSIGQANRGYILTLPESNHGWRIKYQCALCNAEGILTSGFYSTSGTTSDANQATVLAGAQDHSGVDIQMIGGFAIKGRLSFPAGFAATNFSKNILIIAENPQVVSQNQILDVAFGVGDTTLEYVLSVPNANHEWRVKYQCTLCNSEGIVTTGYYGGTDTVTREEDAILLSSGRNHLNINIELVARGEDDSSAAIPAINLLLLGED